MTDSSPSRMSRRQLEELYEGYNQYLATLSLPELAAESTRLGAMIEQDQKAQLLSLLRSVSSSNQDAPVLQSMTPATPYQRPSDASPLVRGSAASVPPPAPSNPLALLASSSRTGPRLAAKLVLADARRRARRAEAE